MRHNNVILLCSRVSLHLKWRNVTSRVCVKPQISLLIHITDCQTPYNDAWWRWWWCYVKILMATEANHEMKIHMTATKYAKHPLLLVCRINFLAFLTLMHVNWKLFHYSITRYDVEICKIRDVFPWKRNFSRYNHTCENFESM